MRVEGLAKVRVRVKGSKARVLWVGVGGDCEDASGSGGRGSEGWGGEAGARGGEVKSQGGGGRSKGNFFPENNCGKSF